jgi:3-hydroxyisobutyrate dehydrogenase-like beta-hydroxyacid dehydrogenase
MTTFERVGFIGLGGMGRGLVKNLVAKGVSVAVYDLDPAAVAVAHPLARPRVVFRRFATTAAS